MAELPTYLAPGQRYARPESQTWRIEDHLTILQVGKNACGAVWVTYRAPDGEDRAGPAARFEEAVAAAEIVPVGGDWQSAPS